jgi:hypothetical protein
VWALHGADPVDEDVQFRWPDDLDKKLLDPVAVSEGPAERHGCNLSQIASNRRFVQQIVAAMANDAAKFHLKEAVW